MYVTSKRLLFSPLFSLQNYNLSLTLQWSLTIFKKIFQVAYGRGLASLTFVATWHSSNKFGSALAAPKVQVSSFKWPDGSGLLIGCSES